MGMSKTNVPRKINQKKKKETRSLQANVITVVRWGIKLLAAGNSRLIKTGDQRIGQRKETESIEVLLGCTKASTIEYKNSEVLFEVDLAILILSNPPNDNTHGKGNNKMEKEKRW